MGRYQEVIDRVIGKGNKVEGDVLGAFLAWSLRSCSPTPLQFEEARDQHYLGWTEKKDPKAADPFKAFEFYTKEAIEAYNTRMFKANGRKTQDGHLELRKKDYKESGIWYRSIHEYRADIDDHVKVGAMVLRKSDTGYVFEDDGSVHEVINAASERWDQHMAEPRILTNDLRSWLCRELAEMQRVSLRDGGGFWYVHTGFVERLYALQAMVAAIQSDNGSQAELSILPQMDIGNNKQFLAEQAHESIVSNINQMMQEVARWQDEDDTKARTSTVEKRLARIEELRVTAGTYNEILDMAQDQLDGLLNDLRDELHQLL